MSKGMSMEEYREALSSEARTENEQLKKELSELKEKYTNEVQDLKNENIQLQSTVNALYNRCFAMTKGSLCAFCHFDECKYAPTIDDLMKLDNYMKKNNIKKAEKEVKSIQNFLDKCRNERILKGDMRGVEE